MPPHSVRQLLVAALVAGFSAGTLAQSTESAPNADARFTLRAQSTFIQQRKPSMRAPYSGPNSLDPQREISRSWTTTIFAGWMPRNGTEVYLNPEMAAGVPLSDLSGLGGLSNGELARTSGANPVFYRARAFVRQTFAIGRSTSREHLEDDDNQVATSVPTERIVITFGNFSALDVFDDSSYAKDPRMHFLNWSLFAPGAWDYPADSRGYSNGLAVEYVSANWTLRAGRFLLPRESNGLRLNYRVGTHYGDVVEFERPHSWGGAAGAIRLLGFRNQTSMGRFRDAVDQVGAGASSAPVLANARQLRRKVGLAVNIEQSLAPGIAVFSRLSWADGKSETFAFTEIDRSYTFGSSINGRHWGRGRDTLGIAIARNELSSDRRAYLAAGGLGYFLGDGRLNYRPEQIIESYYSLALREARPLSAWLSLDVQRVLNPGYNADRGPAWIFGARIHAKF